MLSDFVNIKPKGWVKIETYDPKTLEIIDVVENHNIVTNRHSEVIATVLSNPSGRSPVNMQVLRDTTSVPDNEGYYMLQLPMSRCSTYGSALSGTGERIISLGSARRVARLNWVIVNGNRLEIDRDVWISDEDAGRITFADAPAMGATIDVQYLGETTPQTYIMPGSEAVKVGLVEYERSTETNTSGDLIPGDETYVIDEDTGQVWFNTALEGVSIEYKYKIVSGVLYMGVSDRPSTHPMGRPVVFTEVDKGKSSLDSEYEGTRQPLLLPAEVISGSSYTETIVGNGYDTAFVLSHRDLIEISEVYNVAQGELMSLDDVSILDAASGRIRFAIAPEPTDVLRIIYKWSSGTTISFIADFPQGVPGPQSHEAYNHVIITGDYDSDGTTDTVYTLPYIPTSVESVTLNDSTLTPGIDYNLNGSQIILTSTPPHGVGLEVIFDYTKDSADIYEVGLFTHEKEGKMFAISGIGPITKSISTGMRVTWSITF